MIVEVVETILNVVAVALFVSTLPGTIELALVVFGALLTKPKASAPRLDMQELKLAVIVPVYNEEVGLPTTIKSLLQCEDPVHPGDLIVMACNTTDRSVPIALEMGCTVLKRTDPLRRGKGYGLDFAFRALKGRGYDAYLVVDADTRVERNFMVACRSAFSSGAEAIQCTLRIDNPAASNRTRLINIAFLAFTLMRPLARERLRLSAGIFGNGFGIRADVLDRVPYECYSITEDLEYHTKLVMAGVCVRYIGATSVSTDMRTTASGARSQRERWEGGRFRMMAVQAPRLSWHLVVRRKWRLIEPLCDILLLPLVYHVLILMCLALLASDLMRIYALAGLALVITHIVQAMIIGKATRNDWKALLMVPVYAGWKLVHFGGIIKTATRSAAWRRTERLG